MAAVKKSDRDVLERIGNEWIQKKGLSIIVTCKKCGNPVDYLYGKDKEIIGYRCVDCGGKEWRWE